MYFRSLRVWFRNCCKGSFFSFKCRRKEWNISHFMQNASFFSIFVPLKSVQGDERYEHEVEECFLFLLGSSRAPRYPLQLLPFITPCWSHFHWITRAHFPVTGLWGSCLNTSKNGKELWDGFQMNFHSATHVAQDSCGHLRTATPSTYLEF